MPTDPLRITLDTLRAERRDRESVAHQLREELDSVLQRLANLNGAIESIEALLGEPSEDDRAVLTEDGLSLHDEDKGSATPRIVDFSGLEEPPLRKRVPSTDWVAEVVNAIGEPADRDTIYKKFEEMRGIPESWVSNPRNSLNNALGRAVERRMIVRFGENEFAPVDYNPWADLTRTEG